MDLKYILKQKAQLSLSFLPIGDTPVQRFYFICADHSIYTNSFVDFKSILQIYNEKLKNQTINKKAFPYSISIRQKFAIKSFQNPIIKPQITDKQIFNNLFEFARNSANQYNRRIKQHGNSKF
jgi:hypothetical protein